MLECVVRVTAACGVLGTLYYFIFYSRVQCATTGGRAGRRLLEPATMSSAHDTGGSSGTSTHIFMFKKS